MKNILSARHAISALVILITSTLSSLRAGETTPTAWTWGTSVSVDFSLGIDIVNIGANGSALACIYNSSGSSVATIQWDYNSYDWKSDLDISLNTADAYEYHNDWAEPLSGFASCTIRDLPADYYYVVIYYSSENGGLQDFAYGWPDAGWVDFSLDGRLYYTLSYQVEIYDL